VSDKEDRKLVLSALNAAGYRGVALSSAKRRGAKRRRAASGTPEADENDSEDGNGDRDGGVFASDLENEASAASMPKQKQTPAASLLSPSSSPSSSLPHSPLPPQSPSPSPHKKRKKRGATAAGSSSSHVANEYLPEPAVDEGAAALGSFDFHELLDEDALRLKATVVNRAPVMMAWACVVCERLGFSREEALSIASVYTEMNAISKGVSLGIYDKKREADLKAVHASGGAQPYVDLLGRRVPLYRTASGSWHAFTTEDSSGSTTPGGGGAPPGAAYSYITRALRQTAPAVLGAMLLLAESYDPVELNRVGFGLYADFRPDVTGWGKRGELKCETLLRLRKKGPKNEPGESSEAGVIECSGNVDAKREELGEEPAHPGPDNTSDGVSAGKVFDLEPNNSFDTEFDEFTAEELSALP